MDPRAVHGLNDVGHGRDSGSPRLDAVEQVAGRRRHQVQMVIEEADRTGSQIRVRRHGGKGYQGDSEAPEERGTADHLTHTLRCT